METFSALLALCAGTSPVTGEFPSQRPVTRIFYVSLFFALKKQPHRAHYDLIVMFWYHYACCVHQLGIIVQPNQRWNKRHTPIASWLIVLCYGIYVYEVFLVKFHHEAKWRHSADS